MRGEYRRIQKTFQEALDNARQAGFLGENILGIEGLFLVLAPIFVGKIQHF